ncbi:MAG TPA: hypothetical protein VFZ68_09550 [Acidimicrobiales bacterium]
MIGLVPVADSSAAATAAAGGPEKAGPALTAPSPEGGLHRLATPRMPGQGEPEEPSLGECIGESPPEIYGATDINAQTANGGLSVALNDEGTVTVLRWPSPSFYDHVRYTTDGRDVPDLGVAGDEGMFLGLDVHLADGGRRTTWLRDWDVDQAHAEGWTDAVTTTHRSNDLGLTVTVDDVTAHPADILARRVRIERDDDSPVRAARLLSFENLSLVVSKRATLPVQDWCFEVQNTDIARFDTELDAVIHTRAGTDESTGERSSVAIAAGFDVPTAGQTVGGDSQAESGPPSAYDDARDGDLSARTRVEGHTTSVLAAELDLSDGPATATLYLAAAADEGAAGDLLASARDRGFDDIATSKRTWLEDLLGHAPLPDSDHPAVSALSRRALVTLVTDTDRQSGAIVASIATQSPYGEDWPRDGAFFDYTLDVLGLQDRVTIHHDFYADAQQTAAAPDPTLIELGVPDGNWGMNYYADGIVGGPIAWEIDETGYTLWNLWEHHRAGGDVDELRARYPTIRAAADFLTECRDDTNGLQCVANEDDNFERTQTIVGAGTVWLGLDAAARAAETLGETDDAARWSARRDELGAAIETELWNGDRWGDGSAPLAWPVCFRDFDHPQMAQHLEAIRARLDETFAEPEAGVKERGQYETKGLLALAKAWRDDPAGLAWVRDGLVWVATQHATPDTHVMGEAWQRHGGEIISVVSQPHAWEQVLFYLAALEAWPPEQLADTPTDCDGVLGRLRAAAGRGTTGTDGGDGDGGAAWAGGWALIAGVTVGAALVAAGGAVAVRHRRR